MMVSLRRNRVLYWSSYHNIRLFLGPLWISYDIRNDPRLRTRKLVLRRRVKGEFLDVLKKELEKIRDQAH